MARNVSGVYSKPAGTTAVPGDVIDAATFNTLIDDMVADLNLPRPITAGGTGASTAAGARTNLGLTADDATARTYSTFTELSATEITADVKRVTALTRSTTISSPPIVLKRVDSEPSHAAKVRTADRFLSTGATDASNGGWWEFAGPSITPRQIGCAGDGSTTDDTAFQNWVSAIEATGYVGHGDPGATYKLTTSTTIDASNVVLLGDGAAISFTGTDDEVFDVAGTSASRLSNVEISGWRVTFADGISHLVYARGTTNLRVNRNIVTKGKLIRSWLTSDSAGLTGAAWDANEPDISAVVLADLLQDVEIVGNRLNGDSDTKASSGWSATRKLAAGSIGLGWVDGAVIRDNHIDGARSGILCWGGDASPARDGDEGSTRWARNITIANNVVRDTSSGGIWGGQWENVACTGNTVEKCLDICLHGEGDRNCTYSGNALTDGQFGCVNAYFICENSLYVGNTMRITDSSTYGTDLVKTNHSADDSGFDVSFIGNTMVMEDAAHGRAQFQAGGRIVFQNNTLRNVKVLQVGSNAGTRLIRSNNLYFDHDPSADLNAIALGPFRHVNLDRDAGAVIEGNLIEVGGFTPSGLSAAIRLSFACAAGTERPYAVIRENTIRGHYDNSPAWQGFPFDVITESTNGVGFHSTDIYDNLFGAGRVIDVTDGVTIGLTTTWPQRVKQRGNRSSKSPNITPYSAAPTEGPWWFGSTVDFDAPAAGAETGVIAVGGTDHTVATQGAWSSGGTYDVGEHVTGSDTYIYVRITSTGGAGVDPAGGSSTTDWRRVGDTATTWAEHGFSRFVGSTTWDPGSIADGDEEATTVTVTGAVLGDFCLASFSLDVSDLTLSASVTANDTVTVVLANNTGGAVDLGSGTLRAMVFKA